MNEPSRASAPLLPDVGITAIVPDRWGGPWESRHQVLTRLARWFHVLWVDPAGPLRDLPHEFRTKRPALVHDAAVPPGFEIFARNVYIPHFHKRILARGTNAVRMDVARRMQTRRGVRMHVLYLWRDVFAWALDHGSHDLSVYHIDDEYTFSPTEVPLGARERRVIERAGLVVISSPGLMRRKGSINPRTVRIPNGVDYEAFVAAGARAAREAEPEDLRSIPRPRIGYTGVIKRQLDVDTLIEVARALPERNFVFVGPRRRLRDDEARWDTLAALPNVHMLGEKHFSELPRYVNGLDVCLLSYRKTAYTDQIYPLKLHEYFATGKPVVATPLESFEEFDGLLRLARSPEEWTSQIEAALQGDPQETIEARRRVAREHDWDRLAEKIALEICTDLGDEFVRRLRTALGRD